MTRESAMIVVIGRLLKDPLVHCTLLAAGVVWVMFQFL